MHLPAGKTLTVRTAADVFLDWLGNANAFRSYGIGVGKTAECPGEARPFAAVADDEIGGGPLTHRKPGPGNTDRTCEPQTWSSCGKPVQRSSAGRWPVSLKRRIAGGRPGA